MVKQNIVFVENTPGSLQKVTKILAENQIDIYGFGCFDAPEFANFRMVCDDPEKPDHGRKRIYDPYYSGYPGRSSG